MPASVSIKILPFIILFGVLRPSVCQEYIPFNFDEGIWITDRLVKEWGSYESQFYCNGDTILEGSFYHKLYEYKFVQQYGVRPYSTLDYCGAIINDTVNRTVILRLAGWTMPFVIYNFNLEVGDTIKEGYGSDEHYFEPFVVEEIDSVEMCGRYHKRFITDKDHPWGIHAFIEGIGHSFGFINPILDPFEEDTHLSCYTEKDNNNCSECNLLMFDRLVNFNEEVRLYPNPSSCFFVIECEDEIESIEIYSIAGIVVFQSSNVKSGTPIRSNIQGGIYNVKVRLYGGGEVARKIIIE